MIRLTFLLRRLPDQSLEKFQRYWREEHGPLVASVAQRLNILRYVQVHRIEAPINEQLTSARGGMETPYDGVAELWWENEEKFAEVADLDQAATLLEDERRFIDLAQSPLWFAHEYPQINPVERIVARERSGIVKLHYPLRPPPGITEEAAQHYWRTQHGPLIRSLVAGGPLLRYQQVHRFQSPHEAALRRARGTQTEPYLGHAESWLDNLHREAGPNAAEVNRLTIEDEAKFIDFSRSAVWVGKEFYFVDRL